MKLCIECKHFVAEGETCAAPQNFDISPIDGKKEWRWPMARQCRIYRDIGCGKDGDWWEAKP